MASRAPVRTRRPRGGYVSVEIPNVFRYWEEIQTRKRELARAAQDDEARSTQLDDARVERQVNTQFQDLLRGVTIRSEADLQALVPDMMKIDPMRAMGIVEHFRQTFAKPGSQEWYLGATPEERATFDETMRQSRAAQRVVAPGSAEELYDPTTTPERRAQIYGLTREGATATAEPGSDYELYSPETTEERRQEILRLRGERARATAAPPTLGSAAEFTDPATTEARRAELEGQLRRYREATTRPDRDREDLTGASRAAIERWRANEYTKLEDDIRARSGGFDEVGDPDPAGQYDARGRRASPMTEGEIATRRRRIEESYASQLGIVAPAPPSEPRARRAYEQRQGVLPPELRDVPIQPRTLGAAAAPAPRPSAPAQPATPDRGQAPPSVIPPAVQAAFNSQGRAPGRYRMRDGSVWLIMQDRRVQREQ